MKNEFDFDLIIRAAVETHFPELLQGLGNSAHSWIRAQIYQESRMDPRATSICRARGLMQLMPATARELGVENVFDPVENIYAGVRYLAQQWLRLDEIPDPRERLRFALAAYNGGRGYINQAMVIARDTEGLPGSHSGWRLSGRPKGHFQGWGYCRGFLRDYRCQVAGKHPDHVQIFDYVEKIEARYRHYQELACPPN